MSPMVSWLREQVSIICLAAAAAIVLVGQIHRNLSRKLAQFWLVAISVNTIYPEEMKSDSPRYSYNIITRLLWELTSYLPLFFIAYYYEILACQIT